MFWFQWTVLLRKFLFHIQMKCSWFISYCMNQESRCTQTYRPVTATVVLPDRHPHRHPLTRLSIFFACSHQKSGRTKWAWKKSGKHTWPDKCSDTGNSGKEKKHDREEREEEEWSVLRPSIMHKLRSCFNGWTTSWMTEKVWKLKIKATREETSLEKRKMKCWAASCFYLPQWTSSKELKPEGVNVLHQRLRHFHTNTHQRSGHVVEEEAVNLSVGFILNQIKCDVWLSQFGLLQRPKCGFSNFYIL